MFDGDRKIIQQMAPMVTRVLIVDPQQASARLLGELIRTAFKAEVWAAHTSEKALRQVLSRPCIAVSARAVWREGDS